MIRACCGDTDSSVIDDSTTYAGDWTWAIVFKVWTDEASDPPGDSEYGVSGSNLAGSVTGTATGPVTGSTVTLSFGGGASLSGTVGGVSAVGSTSGW